MVYDNFKHIDPDEFHSKELSLHDCIADRIVLENESLRFYFPEGFWVTPRHKENTFGKTIRTEAAEVAFSVGNVDDITISVFTNGTWFRSKKTWVENWPIDKLIAAINSGKYTLEFIAQYRSYYEQMWHCVIHSPKKPYHRECQLYLPEAKATFLWNDLRPDNEW